MTRPTFVTTIAALRCTDPRFSWVHPTEEEDDIAAVLEAIAEQHQPTADASDDRGRYGRCTGCRSMWPCPEWHRGEQLAIAWLGRAAARVYDHARQSLDHERAT